MFNIFMGDNNAQKILIYNKIQLTVSITDIIISESLSLNLSKKPRFEKVLDLKKKLCQRVINI